MSGDAPLRFVLLRHELPDDSWRPSHDDLMLEREEGLFTLELREPLAIGVDSMGRELPLHRKSYLDYEGPVSQNRGSVRRIDSGTMTVEGQSDDRIEATLFGERLRGRLLLVRESAGEGDQQPIWRVSLRVLL